MPLARQASRWLLLNIAVAGLYALLGFTFTALTWLGSAVPMWPAAGLAFAVALRWGPRTLPGIFVGSMLANLASQAIHGDRGTLLTATLIGVGAALQAFVGAWLVRRFVGGSTGLPGARYILLFLLLAGPVASAVSATTGTIAQVSTDVITTSQAPLAWLVWWAGDAMGVIVFGPVTLMLLPDPAGVWRGWRARVAVPSLLFAGALLGSLMLSQQAATTRLDTQREQAALDASTRVVNQLDRQQEVLQGIKSLFEASKDVTADEFRTFTQDSLDEYQTLQALSWNVALTAEELDAFEASRRAQPDSGSFTVTERGPDGQLRPAPRDRERYVIVDYIEPLASNRPALGYDIASNPDRARTIAEATDSGETTATPPLDLVQSDGDSQKGMLVLDPAYRTAEVPATVKQRQAQLIGFSVGVYKFDDMLAEVFAGQLDSEQWQDVSLELLDISDASAPMTIASRPAVDASTAASAAAPRILSAPVVVNGRVWQMALTPLRGPLAGPAASWAPLALVVAVVVLYLLEALLLLLVSGERRARAEARLRTYEADHDALTGLLNRRGFIRRLEQICSTTATSAHAHVLLFCDLDEFKTVNDCGGHAVGDDMLIEVGSAMKTMVREADVLARIGGDEFAVILVNCPQDKGLQIAQNLVGAVDDVRLTTARGVFTVGVSVGATIIGAGGSTEPDEAIQRADDAAYEAKQSGGGVVVLATDAPQRIVIDARVQDEAIRPLT